MPIKDSMIAATALVHGLAVVTRNGVDFKNAGVKVINPFTGDVRGIYFQAKSHRVQITLRHQNSHGFLATTFPFSQTMIGVPYIRAVFLTLFGMRRIALATESKNRLFSADTFFFI